MLTDHGVQTKIDRWHVFCAAVLYQYSHLHFFTLTTVQYIKDSKIP